MSEVLRETWWTDCSECGARIEAETKDRLQAAVTRHDHVLTGTTVHSRFWHDASTQRPLQV